MEAPGSLGLSGGLGLGSYPAVGRARPWGLFSCYNPTGQRGVIYILSSVTLGANDMVSQPEPEGALRPSCQLAHVTAGLLSPGLDQQALSVCHSSH